MSEKENEIEEEEREMVHHWSHHHPLTLADTRTRDYCHGCIRYFRSGENAYGCSQKCGYEELLHEECAEAPRKITHAMHPQHILTQQLYLTWETQCSICQSYARGILYRCTSAECMFRTHIRCAQGSDMMYADDEQSRAIKISHRSHPKHELRFVRRRCSFKCDACGTTRRGSSYTCTNDACEYWIHERCAFLPHTIQREDHHHSLSLSFHLPPRYLKYGYVCDVCRKRLISVHWIYHCELCSYAVHLNCAFKKSPQATIREKGIMEFPISDVGEDLIGAFVKRQGGDTHTPIPHHDVDYKFHNHKLRLVSSSSSSQEEKQQEEDNSDDDGEDYSAKKSELICDACITPIFVKQRSSFSSSSSSSKDYYYMSCSSGCNYYLHLACFHLPPQLSSLPLIHQHDHHLLLQSSPKLKPWDWSSCGDCRKPTNGLFYACTKCNYFRVDIKCASMPDTIYHAAHPQHPLNFISIDETRIRDYIPCDGCGEICYYDIHSYGCSICEFKVCINCAGLPASTSSRRWDRHHPLPLTHDSTLNHPGDFYCDQCEKEMNPKRWMYHCRTCDLSFHPRCFKTTSGRYINIKFGQKYMIDGAHCHTLTYQLLTTKRRCDVCGKDKHEEIGFHCALCNFFICFSPCGEKMIKDGDIEAVD